MQKIYSTPNLQGLVQDDEVSPRSLVHEDLKLFKKGFFDRYSRFCDQLQTNRSLKQAQQKLLDQQIVVATELAKNRAALMGTQRLDDPHAKGSSRIRTKDLLRHQGSVSPDCASKLRLNVLNRIEASAGPMSKGPHFGSNQGIKDTGVSIKNPMSGQVGSIPARVKELTTCTPEQLAVPSNEPMSWEALMTQYEQEACEGYDKIASLTQEKMEQELALYEATILQIGTNREIRGSQLLTAPIAFSQVCEELRELYTDFYKEHGFFSSNQTKIARKQKQIKSAEAKLAKLMQASTVAFANFDRFLISAESTPFLQLAKRRQEFQDAIAEEKSRGHALPSKHKELAKGRLQSLEANLKKMDDHAFQHSLMTRLGDDHPLYHFIQARILPNGLGGLFSPDIQAAKRHMIMASKMGFQAAQASIYASFMMQKDTVKDEAEWLELVKEQAREGSNDAAAALGEMASSGVETGYSDRDILGMLLKAASEKHAYARLILGQFYALRGAQLGNHNLVQRAEKLFFAGVADKHLDSLKSLSHFYASESERTGVDHTARVKYWLIQEAISGRGETVYPQLAQIYLSEGRADIAEKLYSLSADHGNANGKVDALFTWLLAPTRDLDTFTKRSQTYLIHQQNAQGMPDAVGYFERMETFIDQLASITPKLDLLSSERKHLVQFLVEHVKLIGQTSPVLSVQLKSLMSELLK